MSSSQNTRQRARAIGIRFGNVPTGNLNAITDVTGVAVGHKTLIEGECIRTGVTAILPHDGNLYREKVPAAVFVGNGYGKLAGSTQVDELGTIETPIVLTNTLSVSAGVEALIRHTLALPGNEKVRSVNALVGETNDGYLNDIRGLHVTVDDVLSAIKNATTGPVEEGCIGAGTGTICFGYKGGIGTSSRKLKDNDGGYTIGVLVQTNYGGDMTVLGAPVGRELERMKDEPGHDGSCMIVVATDAPLCARNLKRIAGRTMLGLGRTGSYISNGSGDYAIAFSTAYRVPMHDNPLNPPTALVPNSKMSPLFRAVVEATEEAVYNSLFMATTITGRDGHKVTALPLDEVIKICRRHNVLSL